VRSQNILLILALMTGGLGGTTNVPSSQENPLIYCISTPRSLSTAFFRMMTARGDFICFEELGVDAYTRVYEPEACDIICEDHKPQTFAAAQDFLINILSNSTKPLFVKEMNFAAIHYLFSDILGVINSQKATVLFLVRDPHAALLSLYRKRSEVFATLEDWMDYEALWKTFEQVRNTYTHAPVVVIAEHLCSNPEKFVHAFCDHCNISFNLSHLQWEALASVMESNHPWNSEIGQFWYDHVLQSTGFEKTSVYNIDDFGEPTFQEIDNIEHRAIYKDLYYRAYPYYQKFVEAAIQNF
jgi:hypothetical protein